MVILDLRLTKGARTALTTNAKILIYKMRNRRYGAELCQRDGVRGYKAGFVPFNSGELLEQDGDFVTFQYKTSGTDVATGVYFKDEAKIVLNLAENIGWTSGKNGTPSDAALWGLRALEVIISLYMSDKFFFSAPLAIEASPLIAENPSDQQYFDVDFPKLERLVEIRRLVKTLPFSDVVLPGYVPVTDEVLDRCTEAISNQIQEIKKLVS